MLLEDKRNFDELVEKAMKLSNLMFSFSGEGRLYYDGTSNLIEEPEFSRYRGNEKASFCFLKKKALYTKRSSTNALPHKRGKPFISEQRPPSVKWLILALLQQLIRQEKKPSELSLCGTPEKNELFNGDPDCEL